MSKGLVGERIYGAPVVLAEFRLPSGVAAGVESAVWQARD
jgi:hypothetical protein